MMMEDQRVTNIFNALVIIRGMMLQRFNFKNGMIHAIAQHRQTGEVLMLAHMNEDALRRTIETKRAHYWSRSRNRIWRKGEESGNEQIVHEIRVDCDGDAVLLKVDQVGGACHMGYMSCFYRDVDGNVLAEKVFEPEKVRDENGP